MADYALIMADYVLIIASYVLSTEHYALSTASYKLIRPAYSLIITSYVEIRLFNDASHGCFDEVDEFVNLFRVFYLFTDTLDGLCCVELR
jgi:hypothetical protein